MLIYSGYILCPSTGMKGKSILFYLLKNLNSHGMAGILLLLSSAEFCGSEEMGRKKKKKKKKIEKKEKKKKKIKKSGNNYFFLNKIKENKYENIKLKQVLNSKKKRGIKGGGPLQMCIKIKILTP